jgi:alpha/beta superfamily hydrolase
MNPKTQKTSITGPAGQLEIQIDEAEVGVPFKGTAIVAHPHPLYGGDMNNKVVQTMAKAFMAAGWRAIRFNFRGVGASGGTYAEGIGETQDLLAVISEYAALGHFCLGGFSFGTFTVSHALQGLAASGRDLDADVQRLVLVGAAAGRFDLAPIAPELHNRTFVVHGESDDTVPLSAVMDWARPQTLPVTVVPAGSHFFHGQLPLLKNLVLRHLA